MKHKIFKLMFCITMLLSSQIQQIGNFSIYANEEVVLKQDTQELERDDVKQNDVTMDEDKSGELEETRKQQEISLTENRGNEPSIFVDGSGNVFDTSDFSEAKLNLANFMFPSIRAYNEFQQNQLTVTIPYGLVSDPNSKWSVTFDRFNDFGLNWDCYAQYNINGNHAFCIQPLRPSVNGASDYDEQAFKNLIDNEDIQKELGYIETLGYGFADDYSDEMDWATQIRLWQCLHEFDANNYPAVNDIHEEIQSKINVINHRIDVMRKDVSMKDKTIALKGIGEAYAEFVKDDTNTLADYIFRFADDGIACEQINDDSGSANTLKVWLTKPLDEGNIEYDAWYPLSDDENAIFYASSSSQGLATLGKSKPNAFTLHVELHKGDLQLTKVDEDGKFVENTTFQVSRNEDMSDSIGTYTTGKDGRVKIEGLVPGNVYVQEVEVPKHLVLDETIHEVLLKADECVTFQAKNEWVKGNIKLIKKDKETKVALDGAIYGIYDASGKEVERLTTSAKGYVESSKLRFGTYTVKELHAPKGYVLNDKVMKVTISKHSEALIVEGEDQPVKGNIMLYKEGEVLTGTKTDEDGTIQFIYETRKLMNAEFGVYAKNDIYAGDGKTKLYAKDTLVDTLKTDKKGAACSKNLPLGSYYVKETKAPDGFALSEEVRDVTLSWKDETTKLVNVDAGTFINKRKKATVVAEKRDGESKERLSGAEVALFANQDIKNVDGNIIVKKNTKMETVISDKDDAIQFQIDLPMDIRDRKPLEQDVDDMYLQNIKDGITYLGDEDSMFYMKEVKAPLGYTMQDPIVYYVDTLSDNQKKDILELSYTFENFQTTTELVKVDEENKMQVGNQLQLLDEHKEVLDTWISKDTAHVIRGLQVGKTYTLHEVMPIIGYTKAEDIMFEVKESNEAQIITMKNAKLLVSVLKTDTQGNPLSNATLQIVDERGDVVDEWLSEETAHFIKDLKENEMYILREISAPDGYEKAEDQSFIAVQGTQIELKNNKIIVRVETSDHTQIANFIMISSLSLLAIIYIGKKTSKKRFQ